MSPDNGTIVTMVTVTVIQSEDTAIYTFLHLYIYTFTRKFGGPTAPLLSSTCGGLGALRALLGAFGPLVLLPIVISFL